MKSIEVHPVVAAWRSGYEIDVGAEFHDLPAFDLRACSECSLRFFVPETLTGSGELYAQLEKFDWYYRDEKWEYEVALQDLLGCERILEVGCGSGGFIAVAGQAAGLKIEGIEQNAKAIQEAAHRGLPVRLGTVEEAAEQSPGQYDAVCSFQVLEHLRRPGDFLRASCELLRTGGRLLLGLPNADSFVRHEFNVLDLPPHHMSRWPLKVLSELPRFFPLRLKHARLEPLPDWQVWEFVHTYYSILARGRVARYLQPRVVNLLSAFVRRSGLRRWLRGQTVYACFERS